MGSHFRKSLATETLFYRASPFKFISLQSIGPYFEDYVIPILSITFLSIHWALYLFFIRKLYFPHFLKLTIITEKLNLVFKILIIDVLKNHTFKL